jgi:hypothetical protein
MAVLASLGMFTSGVPTTRVELSDNFLAVVGFFSVLDRLQLKSSMPDRVSATDTLEPDHRTMRK